MQCCRFTCVQLSVTLWTVACQAPLSMGFSRHEYWSGFPCLPPEDLPHSGTELCLFYISCTRMLEAIVRNPAHGKGREEGSLKKRKGVIMLQGFPLEFPEHPPQKPESACFTVLCFPPTLLALTGGCPPTTFFWKKLI